MIIIYTKSFVGIVMSEISRAFTSSYDVISNRLVNKSKILVGKSDCEVQTLWDTGATSSCISHMVVQNLNLSSIGKKTILTPSGEKVVDAYLVNIVLPNGVGMDNVEVCESEIGDQGVDLLVGMDIINKGDFSVTNFNGKTVFTFCVPSMQTIDYTKRINVENLINKGYPRCKRK